MVNSSYVKRSLLSHEEGHEISPGSTMANPIGTVSEKQINGNGENFHTQVVMRAEEFIRKHFDKNIGVDDIAKNVFLSQYHFSRIFKKQIRYSPYQYLLHVRLQYAIDLLYQNNLSLTEISFRSGFRSIDYFSSAFSKKYKVSPSKYRKALKT
jgi:transcriptional regulator GlxA family with amidase domain